jgi:ABC-type transporter Mla maintaining outer membrane lipid asymmetry ATPase subunit MlaF
VDTKITGDIPEDDTILELKNVSLYSDNYKILDDISCRIKRNTFNVILGQSGAGKSTLLKVMSGILPPQQGKVLFKGHDLNHCSPKRLLRLKKIMGFCFQDAALLSNLSVQENLLLPLDFHFKSMSRKKKMDRIYRDFEQIGMENCLHQRPAQLSHGEQKLVSFLRSMITRPELLFLDDPLTYIDPIIFNKMIKLIGSYSDIGWTTIICITHSRSIIKTLSDQMLFIYDKSLFFSGNTEEARQIAQETIPYDIKDYVDYIRS